MNGNGSVAFRVYGKPKTQGSNWSPKGSNRVLHDNSEVMLSWRGQIGETAAVAWRSKPIAGKAILHACFKFSRPKSHFGTGRNAAQLKPSAPKDHIQKPDLDKLIRCLKDGLSGVIYNDDCQVCQVHGKKEWVTEGQGALIIIETEPREAT